MNYYTIERKKGEPYVGTSIKYRLYPNKQQEKWLIDMGNKCRGAYNQLVKNYIEGKEAKEFPKTNMKSRTLLYNYLNTIEWLDDLPSIIKEDVVYDPNFKGSYNVMEIKSIICFKYVIKKPHH